jgi:peptidyl-prolyl cis-trans isomerase C
MVPKSGNAAGSVAIGAGGRVAGRFWLGLLAGVALSAAIALTCGRGPDSDQASKAGAADSTAETPQDRELGKLIVARVGKRKITIGDIKEKIRLQYTQMAGMKGLADVQQMREVLKAMVDQYAWVDTGERLGFDKDRDFLKQQELMRKFNLANVTVKKLVYDKSAATEEEIRSYYDENPDQFRWVAHGEAEMILLPGRADAERVRRLALEGRDFSQLASQYSIDPETKAAAGHMGTVTMRSELMSIGNVPEINAKIMALKEGEISEPIQTSRGWALFHMRQFTPEALQPLDSVRETIQKKLTAKRANELFSTLLGEAKQQAGMALDDAVWLRYVISRLSGDEVLQYAQEEKNPADRIRIYQTLADEAPKDPKAPQAAFMVGFTYADDLRDYAKAREAFQKMLEKYPQSELAESARWMMANMEKGLENLPDFHQIKRKISGR